MSTSISEVIRSFRDKKLKVSQAVVLKNLKESDFVETFYTLTDSETFTCLFINAHLGAMESQNAPDSLQRQRIGMRNPSQFFGEVFENARLAGHMTKTVPKTVFVQEPYRDYPTMVIYFNDKFSVIADIMSSKKWYRSDVKLTAFACEEFQQGIRQNQRGRITKNFDRQALLGIQNQFDKSWMTIGYTEGEEAPELDAEKEVSVDDYQMSPEEQMEIISEIDKRLSASSDFYYDAYESFVRWDGATTGVALKFHEDGSIAISRTILAMLYMRDDKARFNMMTRHYPDLMEKEKVFMQWLTAAWKKTEVTKVKLVDTIPHRQRKAA